MNRDLKRMQSYLSTVGFEIDEQTLMTEYNSQERKHLERLTERAAYLYIRLQNGEQKTKQKFLLEKDEYRALEFILNEMGVIKPADKSYKTLKAEVPSHIEIYKK